MAVSPLSPPIAFLVVTLVALGFFYAASLLSFKRKGVRGSIAKPYAGGEEMTRNRFQPNYSQFFPFAFFFTILHVVALIVATSPARTLGSLGIAVLYVAGALLGLFILFRR
jgi:NADH:ubiquinone oxidoreductase subunit 3 (subunit A)